ncbi:MAG: heavy metal-associated domain-containing protein, partial [Moraxella sp.]|nr:heavy metal-associated domain-containing protein [Moraxella sp.]
MSNQIHTLAIQGMTCQACATRLEKVLNKKDSVQRAEVNFATETLTLCTNSDTSH